MNLSKPHHENGNGQFEGNGYAEEPQITLRDYIRVLYRSRFIILISFIVILGITLFITFRTEPVYQATAKIMVEEQGGVGESLFDVTSMMKKETMINNQVEILSSRTLAEQVIRELQVSDQAPGLRMIQSETGKSGSGGGILGWFKGSDEKAETDVASEFDQYVERLRNSIKVNPIRNTDMVEISINAFSAFEAAFIANTVTRVYQNMNRQQSQEEVRQVKNFLEEQLDMYQSELANSEETLKNYQERSKIFALDQETEELVQNLSEFETLYNEAKTEYEANRQRLAYINEQLDDKNINIDVDAISSQPYLEELRKQIAEKEAELTKYMASLVEIGTYSQAKNQVQLLERQISALKEKFKQEVTKAAASQFIDPAQISGSLVRSKIEVETQLQSLEPKIKALGDIVTQYNAELEALPGKSLKLARLMRKRQSDEKIYIMLQEKYQESRITEVGQLGIIRIIDPAMPPKYPVKPRKKLNILLGMLVGLGMGVAVAFVLEYLDNSVRSIEDLERMSLPMMSTIPYIRPEETNGVLKTPIASDPEVQAISDRLVTHLQPKSPISEAYRTLRTNIIFSSPDEQRRVFLVTSSGPKEGKSTSVSNLAITFAQMGTKTLLIDADLRRPILHKLFGLKKEVGLTNVLVGRAALEDATDKVRELPDLDILSCGVIPPNPAELLGSERMRQLLETLKQRYNVILIDTPPIIAVTDASVLAPLADGVLLVVRSAQTQKDAALHAYEQLRRVKANVLGVILNGLQAFNSYGSYYYYQYHYYYGKDSEKKRKRFSSRFSKSKSRM